MRLIVDIFRQIVEETVSNDLTVGQTVFFYAGTYQEVTNELTQRGQTQSHKDKRYPFVWLVIPYVERRGLRGNGSFEAQNLRLIIAQQTRMEWDTSQRLEGVFKPLLLPIWEAFLKGLAINPEIDTPGYLSIPHTLRMWPYWGAPESGTRGANIFNDMVDVVEISDLNLMINPLIC